MPLQQKIFALSLGIGLLVVIIEMVRRRKLAEEYSFLWLLTGVGIVMAVFGYEILEWITYFIGARTPTTILFILGFIFMILINLHYSVKITKLTVQVKELAQMIAINKKS